jgi:LysR family transcriptional regulator, nod-box dependent transcriptional activator
MPDMKLRRYDLNLLPILEALLRRRSVTRAGEDIGLSQSATSHALIRLREQLGDELLRFSGRDAQLTPRAEALVAPLQGALELLERLLDFQRFDPVKSQRTFTILTADYMGALVLPKLLKRIDKEAPGITIQVTWGRGKIPELLHANKIDVALMPQAHAIDPNIRSEVVFLDEMVVVASVKNQEIGKVLDFATFQRLPHVAFRQDFGEPATTFADLQVIRQGVEFRKTVIVPNFLLLPLIAAESRCVALTHRSLAEHMRKMAKVRILPPPFPTEKVEVSTLWSRAMDHDPAHRWLRQVLKEICAKI